MLILRILNFGQKVNAIGFAFLQKYANYNNSYFWTKRKAIGFAFLEKYANSENFYFWAKSKAIGFAFLQKYANSDNSKIGSFEISYFGAES